MARGRGVKQYFNFTRGWNTEASPMTFPENTASDLDNVIIDVDGSIRRRPGLDYERNWSKYGLALSLTEIQTWAISFHEWNNVGGSGSLTFAVTQYGNTLHFHRVNGDMTSATSIGTIDMTPFVVNTGKAPETVVQMDDGLGVLFVCGRYIDPFYVEYDGSSLSATAVSMQIRDFDGNPTKGFAVDTRPVTADEGHVYDLLNAGWPVDRLNTFCGTTVINGTPPNISIVTLTATNTWPSRADVQYFGTKVDGSGNLTFDRNELVNQTFGNTPAPNGHYILDAFQQDRNAATGQAGATNTLISARPEGVAFHNGRVFWAGIFTQGLTGNVYFSQQLTKVDKAGKCYQEQDPTAEDFNDLLATDGGVIPIPNAGQILRIAESGDGILVFASNGVWQIGGSEGKFSATDFAVTKITDVGCISGESVLMADNTFLYWSDAGIIALRRDDISANLSDVNLTKNTIQTGYLLIGGIQRRFARGAYITEEKKAVWLYNTESSFDAITDRFKYNGVLVLDMQTGAFYKYSISDVAAQAPYAAGIIKTVPFASGDVTVNVTVGGVTVTVGGADVTVTSDTYTGTDISAWKILTVIDSDTASSYDFTMSEFYSRSWHDWFKQNGVGANFTSYLETGYELQGSALLDKTPTYVFTYFSPESKSLASGGYYELPPLIDFSSGFRTTQCVKETLCRDTTNLRMSQVVKETLMHDGADMRVSQCVKETIVSA